MNQEGFVSFWLVKSYDFQQFKSIIQESYDEDGDYIPSKFALSFDVEYIDPALIESEIVEPKETLKDLLKGASFDEIIVPRFEKLLADTTIKYSDFNAVVLLYDYKYGGDKITEKISNNIFSFIGYTAYLS